MLDKAPATAKDSSTLGTVRPGILPDRSGPTNDSTSAKKSSNCC